MTPNCSFWYHLPPQLRWECEARDLFFQTLPLMYSVRVCMEGMHTEGERIGMPPTAVMFSKCPASFFTRTKKCVLTSPLRSLERRLS